MRNAANPEANPKAPKAAAELEALETREWLESLDYVLQSGGAARVSRLLRDDTLYVHLVSVVSRADSLVGAMSNGKGTIQKMFTDQQLYDQLVKTVTELNNVLADMRRDPRRLGAGRYSRHFSKMRQTHEPGDYTLV